MVFVNPAGQTNDVTSMLFLLSEKRYKVNCLNMQDNWKVLIWSAVVGPIKKSKRNLTAQHVTQTIFLIALDRQIMSELCYLSFVIDSKWTAR